MHASTLTDLRPCTARDGFIIVAILWILGALSALVSIYAVMSSTPRRDSLNTTIGSGRKLWFRLPSRSRLTVSLRHNRNPVRARAISVSSLPGRIFECPFVQRLHELI